MLGQIQWCFPSHLIILIGRNHRTSYLQWTLDLWSEVATPSTNEVLPAATLPVQAIACFWDEFAGDGDTGADDYVITKP